ncbi:MAG: peroxiredoxin [Chlamydia sp.]
MTKEKIGLHIGDTLPQFQMQGMDGMVRCSKTLEGHITVLYFYPKDDTPGCTKEACGFRDSIDHFKKENVLVIGISPDSCQSHKKFIEKYGLPFELISDPDYEIAEACGAIRSTESNARSIVRTTLIVDSHGKVAWIEKPVTVDGHIQRVQNALTNIK